MIARPPITRKSSKGQHDEATATATQGNTSAPDERFAGTTTLDPQVRHQMIALAAYCRAEKCGFAGGAESQLRDWLEAEAELDRMLAGTSIMPAPAYDPINTSDSSEPPGVAAQSM